VNDSVCIRRGAETARTADPVAGHRDVATPPPAAHVTLSPGASCGYACVPPRSIITDCGTVLATGFGVATTDGVD